MINWFLRLFQKPIEIRIDGKCDCNCADKCPLGKTGFSARCTILELFWSNIKMKKKTTYTLEDALLPPKINYKPGTFDYYPKEDHEFDKPLFEIAKRRTGK